jgi:SAM-dependent methyltransferase
LNKSSPVEAFINHTTAALRAGTLVRLLVSAPADRTQAIERIEARLVEIKSQPLFSITLREPRRDTTENLPLEAVPGWLAKQLDGRFRSAVLDTTESQWQFTINSRNKPRLGSHRRPSGNAPQRGHDLTKAGVLDESAQPWLQALGLCDESGRVKASMADKHRQLERYLEILSHLARDCGWTPASSITIADMGCGKGYLTFGVWHLLNRRLGLPAEVIGVEVRSELAEKAESIARALKADALRFVAGDIASTKFETLDGLIALHACNTATDQAIKRGVQAGAKLIVVSPCCHQELRPQLGRPSPLAPLLAHGILAERLSEWLTDGLRALRLEQAGYATKVIEFVASEHTPRNLLIAGVRRTQPGDAQKVADQIHTLKEFFQLKHLASDELVAP